METEKKTRVIADNKVKTKKKAILCTVIICFVIIVSVLLAFVSKDKFGTFNFISGGTGFLRIMQKDAEYVQVQSNPRVILTNPDNSFEMFISIIESEGYTYLSEEGTGNMLVIEKDGVKETVSFSLNGYIGKFVWN